MSGECLEGLKGVQKVCGRCLTGVCREGINPLSPGVLYPGWGGLQDPQLYFGFLGIFYAP